jgi:creatinine amidohydrolase
MQLANLSWPAVQSLSKDTPIIFPVAALEQHGGHMPLFTDSLLLGEIVRRSFPLIGDRAIWAPLMWLGNSDHHLDFPGTLSAAPRVYLDMLNGLAENFIQHGFKRIIFLNGHGGNDVPGKQAVFELRQRHRERDDLLLLFATYWSLGAEPWNLDPSIEQRQMGHACEWETSMMMVIRPELVRDVSKLKTVEFGNPFEPASRGWITKDRTAPGHIGSPQLATAAKGEALFVAFTDSVVKFIERVIRWDGKSWNG